MSVPRRHHRRTSGVTALAALAALCALLAGCVSIPADGPVVPAHKVENEPSSGPEILAHSPYDGSTPTQLVRDFLTASATFANDHERAREYLLPDPEQNWRPGTGVVIYSDITVVSVNLLGDQCEVPFGVGITKHHPPIRTQLLIQARNLTEPPVMRHDATLHGERVGVLRRPSARGRPAHVGDKRCGFCLLGRVDERLVTERRLWLLIENGCSRRSEEADASPVGVATTLNLQ